VIWGRWERGGEGLELVGFGFGFLGLEFWGWGSVGWDGMGWDGTVGWFCVFFIIIISILFYLFI
jgi:hypothetical protein